MTLPRPAAIVLAMVAGRVAGLVHPASGTVTAVHSAATSAYRRHRNTGTRMLNWRGISRQCSGGSFVGGQAALFLQRRRSPTGAAASALRGMHPPPTTSAVQMAANRQPRAGKAGGGGPPIGGYPPPEHLHGVFAVYKPKGVTSNDVVQNIKGALTRGLRKETQARIALERGVASPDKEGTAGKNGETEAAAAAAAAGAVGLNGEGAASKGEGGAAEDGGAKLPRTKKGKTRQTRRRPPGPKVKVGHGGTLDPMATGVLVIGVGKGCRELGNYLQGGKRYRALALLGHETDTQDAEGGATVHGEWGHVTNEKVDAALKQFVGDITQVPPMFSALHKDGQRLYELARKGITVEREARPVTVYSLRQTEPAMGLPLLGLEMECGGGFYVRTLVEDLARALGTRGHMTALERTKQGPFEIEDAVHQAEWEYEHLCTYLGDVEEMTARLELLSKGQGSASESEASSVVPAVPSMTATALER